MERKTIANPVAKDKATSIATSSETNGEYTYAEVEVSPGGGNMPHYHKTFSETFTVLEGELSVLLKNRWKLLHKGESITVLPGVVHCFANKSKQQLVFRVKITPGHEGFEKAVTILYGLASDGLVKKDGTPSKISHAVLLSEIGDIHPPGLIPSLLGPLFKMIAASARRRGIEQALINKYVVG